MRKISILAIVVCLIAASACASHAIPSPSAATPGNRSFDLALERGLLFLARGEYGRAAAELRAAVEVKPDSSKAHNYLGLCYFHQKDYDPAKEQFEKAVALDPSFATAYNNLAGVMNVKYYSRLATTIFPVLRLIPVLFLVIPKNEAPGCVRSHDLCSVHVLA